ncbi:RagB/SusD family nutrient uptake outer membrane protein [Aquimarina agarilytica]|uniref:RagB/SusD family nutrient uptake outer membrane protein n=1 Tax=Aquimarina agarilytica TaxID=1087449 RepID=UPI00028A03A3|nr:RagB/SusD family nutrient uptake outer membrane protein [Aquimarina agarilytica]
MFFNKIKNSKKYLAGGSLMLLISLTLNSCVDIDEVSDVEDIIAEGIARAEDIQDQASELEISDLDDLVLNVYRSYYDLLFLNGYNVPAWAGDDVTTLNAASKDEFRSFDTMEFDSENPRMIKYHNDMATVLSDLALPVAIAESFIGLVTDPDALSETERVEFERAQLLYGELLFVRSLSFHQTLRMFGKVGLTIEDTPAASLSDHLEAYEKIEEDLLLAIDLLPNIHPDATEPGAARPNKGSARALLVRVYMDWAGFPVKDVTKYVSASDQAKLVIDNKSAHGFDLEANFGDLWLEANANNKESCFSFVFDKSASLDNRKYGQVGLPGIAPLNGWDETSAEIRFFEDFPEQPRKDATYRMDLDWEAFPTQPNPVFSKVAGPLNDLQNAAFSTDRSDFWIRYADVLLMYAEASARSGQITALSWEALNQVRRRAEGLPFEAPDASVDLTTGDLAELAVTERKWEFAGEWLRWYDLVRLERVADALSPEARKPKNPAFSGPSNPVTGDTSTNNYFSKIPQSILDVNPGWSN